MNGVVDRIGRRLFSPAVISKEFAAGYVGCGLPCFVCSLEAILTNAETFSTQLCIGVGLVANTVIDDLVDKVLVVLLWGWSVG